MTILIICIFSGPDSLYGGADMVILVADADFGLTLISEEKESQVGQACKQAFIENGTFSVYILMITFIHRY